MTIANWCIAAACLLPTTTFLLAKVKSVQEGKKTGGGMYDNKQPRAWAARQTGWKQRAHAAHLNGFEALPLFIAAVILAQQAHADQGRIDLLAMAFIGIRLLYTAIYLANFSSLRTLVWLTGIADCLAILALA
ncbi:MAG: MAPEG family protein [Pseudomonadota bacterium]